MSEEQPSLEGPAQIIEWGVSRDGAILQGLRRAWRRITGAEVDEYRRGFLAACREAERLGEQHRTELARCADEARAACARAMLEGITTYQHRPEGCGPVVDARQVKAIANSWLPRHERDFMYREDDNEYLHLP